MSQLTEDDFAIEQTEVATPVMDRLRKAAQEAVDMEQVILDLEEQARRLKSDLQKLKNVDIPDLMTTTGQSSFTTTDGWTISLENFVSGTLPKDPQQKQRAIDWLDEHGAGDLIKTEITVAFDKDERELAHDVYRLLENYNAAALDPEMSSSIHHQTLLAHARERLRNGEELPALLGIYVGRVARIVPPGQAKKGKK